MVRIRVPIRYGGYSLFRADAGAIVSGPLGKKLNVRSGSRARKPDGKTTKQCAEWSNSQQRAAGYMTYGNAWDLSNVDMVWSGYDGLDITRPESYNRAKLEKYNDAAAQNLKQNFNTKKILDTDEDYVVNMYYSGSPALEEAYKSNGDVTGTHTGVLTYDDNDGRWYVTHNIHGVIHRDPWYSIQGGGKQYGATAVYSPRVNSWWNQFRGMIGFKSGGIHINPKNEGKFTESANRAGMGVQEYARHILDHKENYSPTMVRRANFARNASKWKHDDGGAVPPFKSFDDWYRSITHNATDTSDYNLRRAYDLAPASELEMWRNNPENHLHTGYWNGDVYEFMKSKDHPTVNYEIDWYNSPDGDGFRRRYALDTTGDTYRYVPRYKVRIIEP